LVSGNLSSGFNPNVFHIIKELETIRDKNILERRYNDIIIKAIQ